MIGTKKYPMIINAKSLCPSKNKRDRGRILAIWDRYTTLMKNKTYYFTKKYNSTYVYGWTSRHNAHPYMHVKFRQKVPGGIAPDDIIYMRSSEMYLIEAEAEAMLNNVPAAQAALQALGSARDSAYDASIFADQASLIDHIKWQRELGLWGEGFGYTDKIRWDDGIDHDANGGSGASSVLYQDAYQVARPSINNDWIFKIPQKEIDANPNLTSADQN